MTNKPFNRTELKNGVVIEFFDQTNRYFGDFNRVKISVIATIPILASSLPADLQKVAATYPGFIVYEKSLEQMGVVTSQVKTVTESLVTSFITSVGSYLERQSFAENLLRKDLHEKTERSYFKLQ